MAEPDKFIPPLFGFRFAVAFTREPIAEKGGGMPPGAKTPDGEKPDNAEDLCEGAFSEVTGLEASMEPKVIKEGGANYGAHQRAGQVSFSTVVLKRGVTSAPDLWNWWKVFAGAADSAEKEKLPEGKEKKKTSQNGAFAHRLNVRITHMDANGNVQLQWRLERAMPVKFKCADFNARATEVAIEELHFVHEGLFVESPSAPRKP